MSSNIMRHHYYLCFFNDTATTEIYTLSLHDALPIYIVDGAAAALGNLLDDGEVGQLQPSPRIDRHGGQREVRRCPALHHAAKRIRPRPRGELRAGVLLDAVGDVVTHRVDRADELVPFADFRRVILCDGMRAGERRIDLLEPQEGGARGSNIGLFRFPQAED